MDGPERRGAAVPKRVFLGLGQKADFVQADLLGAIGHHGAAEGIGHELRAEAKAKHRALHLARRPDEDFLGVEKAEFVLLIGAHRATAEDHAGAAIRRRGHGFAAPGMHHIQPHSELAHHLREKAGMVELAVLDEEDAPHGWRMRWGRGRSRVTGVMVQTFSTWDAIE
jgi:hypothetical protein